MNLHSDRDAFELIIDEVSRASGVRLSIGLLKLLNVSEE